MKFPLVCDALESSKFNGAGARGFPVRNESQVRSLVTGSPSVRGGEENMEFLTTDQMRDRCDWDDDLLDCIGWMEKNSAMIEMGELALAAAGNGGFHTPFYGMHPKQGLFPAPGVNYLVVPWSAATSIWGGSNGEPLSIRYSTRHKLFGARH